MPLNRTTRIGVAAAAGAALLAASTTYALISPSRYINVQPNTAAKITCLSGASATPSQVSSSAVQVTCGPSVTTPPPTSTPTTSSTVPPPPPPPNALPGPANTGVPAGTALTASGSVTVTTNGTIIDALDVSGCIVVHANNVTIKRTRVRGGPCDASHNIDNGYGTYSGLVVSDVEIDGMGQNPQGAAIGNANFTCIRCNIHDVGQGASIDSNVVIQDSWVHHLVGNSVSHNDGIVALGGSSNVTIRHNTLSCDVEKQGPGGCSAALALYNAYGPLNNFTVDGNLFNGGSYCVYGGNSHNSNPTTNMKFTNNRFGRALYSQCGIYGTVTSYSSTQSGNVWTGNAWDDTGAAITP